MFQSITCRLVKCWTFFPRGTEDLRQPICLCVMWVEHTCVSQEYCVEIMLFLMQNRTPSVLSQTEGYRILLYVVTMVENNWKLDLFQTVERWLLGPDRFTVAFKSHKWHHLLFGVCKCRQLNNSQHSSTWKPEPVIDCPVSDLGPAEDQRGN